jgi:putative lipoic acid-binding regulatory protein
MMQIDSDKKLKDLLEFPCSFTYKVMGHAKPELPELVLEVIQRHAPGDYTPRIKPSAKGNYHSVSVTITATHIEQVETLYKELGEIDIVRMVL